MTGCMFDADDWSLMHSSTATEQGWTLVPLSYYGPYTVEISPANGSIDLPSAVDAMRQAYQRRETHAVAAYRLIKTTSPSEYGLWRMWEW